MPLQEEVLLMILIVGLYLYDSMKLLYCNEAVLMPAHKGWEVRFGLKEPQISGKELFIPAPHLPHRPMFRLAWQFEGGPSRNVAEDWEGRRKVPPALVSLVWSTAVALFLLLPLGFFTRLGHEMLLAAVLLLYVGIVAMLGWLGLHRDQMGLSKKQVAALALEYLLCPPFALNVVRRISSSREIGEDLVAAARRLQDAERWTATSLQLTLRLDEEIAIEDEGSERMAGLQAQRLKLAQ